MPTSHRQLWAYLFIVISRLPHSYVPWRQGKPRQLKEGRLKRCGWGVDSTLWTPTRLLLRLTGSAVGDDWVSMWRRRGSALASMQVGTKQFLKKKKKKKRQRLKFVSQAHHSEKGLDGTNDLFQFTTMFLHFLCQWCRSNIRAVRGRATWSMFP